MGHGGVHRRPAPTNCAGGQGAAAALPPALAALVLDGGGAAAAGRLSLDSEQLCTLFADAQIAPAAAAGAGGAADMAGDGAMHTGGGAASKR